MPGGFDLMDKELSVLIWEATFGKPNVSFVVITDCCYCGTITKALDQSGESDVTERMITASNVPQAVENYYGFNTKLDNQSAFEKSIDQDGQSQFKVARGPHIHLAASQDYQTSKELSIDNVRRGAFTHSMIKILNLCEGRVSYRDLADRAGVLVKHLASDQDPDVNAVGGLTDDDEQKIFLTKELLNTNGKRLVFHSREDNQWYLKGGCFTASWMATRLTSTTSG
ncbi:MAG: hypothetical protein WDO15_06210 [Bacteroidota bacterium]